MKYNEEKEDELDRKQIIRNIAKKKGLKGNKLTQFMAQVEKETGGFKQFEESPYYSVKAMRKNFSKARGMTDEELKQISPKYSGTKEKFFNTFYSNRKDLGTGENEGALYYGRGPIQLTGKYNYQKYNVDPEKMSSDFEYATEKSVEYFKDVTKNIPENERDTDKYTKIINKATPTYKQRKDIYKTQEKIEKKGQYLFGSPKQEKEISRGPASMSIEKIEEEEKKLDAAARANLLKQNKEEVIQSLVERQDLSDDEKLKAAKFLDNDKEVLKSAERTAGLRPKQSGLAAQFKDALTFFAPQLIGGAIAQSIEGTDEAFVAGFQQAGTMRDSYNKYKQDLADLALRERGAVRAPKGFQQTDYVTQDGQPATFDPNTGKYKTQDGKVVNPRELKNSISARQEQNLQRADERIALSKSQFTQQLQKDSQLSDTQIKQIGDFENSLKSVAEIDRLFTDAETGPVIGRVQSLQQLADASPDVFNKLKAEAAAAKLAYQKATSGLQVNEREIEMIASILPNENDAPGVFKSKLDVFKRIVTAHKDSFMQAIKTGQPLKAEVVEDIARQTSQITPENKKEQVDIQKQLDIIKKIKAGRR